jgi:hypothetical protein
LLSAQVLVSRGERTKAIETLATFAAAGTGEKSKDLARVFGEMAEMYLADDELVDAMDALRRPIGSTRAMPRWPPPWPGRARPRPVDVASAALRAFVATRNHV